MKPQDIIERFDLLCGERANLESTLQIVERFVMPFRSEFHNSLHSEYEVEWSRRDIYDATAVVDNQQLAAKVAFSLFPHTHRWFNLAFNDDDVNEDQGAREWLDVCQERVWKELSESDFHEESGSMCLDLSGFGTGTMLMEEVYKNGFYDGLDFTATPLMDAFYEHDTEGHVMASYIRRRYTSNQIAAKWPDSVDKLQIDEKDPPGVRHEVICGIYWRDRDNDGTRMQAPSLRPVGMKWVHKATAVELGKEGGYYYMPNLQAVWNRVAGSRYGYGPAILALADILQLNDWVAMTDEAAAKAVDPPYWSTERGIIGDLDLRSGGLTMITDPDKFGELPNGSNFPVAVERENRLQENIHRYFLQDLLDLKLSPEMTATEVHARMERMREQFGPTVGSIEKQIGGPVIENTFIALMRNGKLPPPPPQVQGAEMDIEFTGKLSRIMRSGDAEAAEAWAGFTINLGQVEPGVLDNVDFDALAIGIAESRGVPAKYRRGEQEIEALREERAKKQELLEQIAATKGAGDAMTAAGQGAQAMEGVNAAP